MKRITINILAIIGILALTFLALRFATYAMFPGYEEDAKAQFGSPEAIAAIESLYARVEAAPTDPTLKIVQENISNFPCIRKIPKSWLPQQFLEIWGTPIDNSYAGFGDVLAYYDNKDALIGIEFYGSRYGCFASRDATRCPSWFQSLHRLAEKPLYVTSRITGED